ncbi:hypothetical protein BANRA_05261 [Escherichia coli]|uniref:Major facilitator superfamily (MFS) profile domain-containing protein n=1 Tax=Escherichia coli TaxID=562 RepID=A0A3P5E0H3_ECOLX|nr:hypothetical protein BANRA_05261 [Escherichia coli]
MRWNYTGISQYLIGEWHIGKEELGILGSAFFYAYAIGQSPWGTLTDILGGRRVISIGILITAIMFLSLLLRVATMPLSSFEY